MFDLLVDLEDYATTYRATVMPTPPTSSSSPVPAGAATYTKSLYVMVDPVRPMGRIGCPGPVDGCRLYSMTFLKGLSSA